MVSSRKPIKILVLIVVFAVAAVAILAKGEGVKASNHWEFEVFATGLNKVDNIVIAPDRSMYLSLELPDGQGQVMRLEHDKRTVILAGLQRPDGLFLVSNQLYVTEEVEAGRVINFNLDDGGRRVIAVLDNAEGIGLQSDGNLVITEDLPVNGRVVSVDLHGTITPLVTGLKKPEGLSVAKDGRVYVAESGTGRILRVDADGAQIAIGGLQNPDQVKIAPDGAIWITEDRRSGRVLRYLDGKLETILTGMRYPQGIAIDDGGWVYIAEQGRNRIIRLRGVL